LPQRNTLTPSVKNGRFSWKKLSTSERLTTAGSISTWPKSGFTVALSVSLEPRLVRRSPPTAGSDFQPLLNGSAGSTCDRSPVLYVRCSVLLVTYGISSTCRPVFSPSRPCSSGKRDT
jgi:hypothetical protein